MSIIFVFLVKDCEKQVSNCIFDTCFAFSQRRFSRGVATSFLGKIQRRTRVLSFGVALLPFAALRRSSLFFEVLLFLVLLVGFDLQRGLVPCVQRGYDRRPELAFYVFARVLRHIAAAARDVSVLIKVFGLFLP